MRSKWLAFNRSQRNLLISLGLTYLTALIFCYSNSARDPGSYFFRPSEGYRPEYSVKRIDEALNYLSALNQTDADHQTLRSDDPTICVGIVTVRRPLMQTLDVTVGSILDGLSPEQRSKISMQVLFALSDPKDHPNYRESWVANTIDNVLTYKKLHASASTFWKLEIKKKITEKSLIDYRLSLESCYNQTAAPWIMMLEDDVVAQKKWYDHTMQGLQMIEEWKNRGVIDHWFYLRLFYTEKFLGWNSENWHIYFVWSLVAVSIPAFMGICTRRKAKSMQTILTNQFIGLVCLICVPMFIVLYFLAGRVTLHPMKPGLHLMNRYGCCSQALLFPRENIPPLVDYLDYRQRKSPKPVDSVIEALANEEEWDRLVLSPSQMQHVGAASYKEARKSYEWEGPHRVRGAHGVWSMGFEKAQG